jgi:hypothetical protein
VARFFTGLFGRQQQTQPPASGLRVNTSLQGVPIAIILGGQARLSGNLIDYFGFNYQTQSQGSSGGGKGGSFGGGSGKGQSGGGGYDYYVSFELGICEGPIANVDLIWINGTATNAATGAPFSLALPSNLGSVAYEIFFGDYAQQPWGYTQALQSLPPNQFLALLGLPFGLTGNHARNYRGVCYAAFQNYPLGSSPALPNLTFRVTSTNNSVLPGQPDGDAAVALNTFLTNQFWGVGFPTARLGSLSRWQNQCLAVGLVVSPVLASTVQASAFINDLTAACNGAPCWQDGFFTVEPYLETAVTAGQVSTITETRIVPNITYPSVQVGNFATFAGDRGVTYNGGAPFTRLASYAPPLAAGTYYQSGGTYYFSQADANQTVLITYDWAATASYIPDTQSVWDFTLDDYLPNQGSIGSGLGDPNSPIRVVRKPRDQMFNNIKVEYLDRANNYNPVDIEFKNEAMIVAFGRERPSAIKQRHFFCLASAAQQSAVLEAIREEKARTFQWTVGRHFTLIIGLMKVGTLTDPGRGLVKQPVRIIGIDENPDASLTLTGEEFLGTVSAPAYGVQGAQPYPLNRNVDPGAINAPLIFEPTDQLGGGNVIWAAVSGVNPALWGGAFVYASYEQGGTYTRVGTVGPARMGTLSADLPLITTNAAGQTVDQTNTLSVDLTESAGTLASGTNQDATALNNRCYVGGEIISFATATLTAANKYDLTYLVRGALGTPIGDHPAGTLFARLDDAIAEFAFDQSRIGSVLYLKFRSFNIWQGGLQSLADVPAYPYVIQGVALASPLPSVQNLRSVYDVNLGFTILDWDDITDFRTFKYEIRSGSSPAAAFTLGQVAHPPFRVPGNGTYWVAAVAQPVAGLTVYSAGWADVAIAGAVITQNIVKTFDLKSLNWPGVFTGGAGVDNVINAIRSGGGNILLDPDVVGTADVLNYGGGQSGVYYPGVNARLDIGYVANASVAITYQPTGVPVGQNILTVGGMLADPDVLGSAATRFITVTPQIRTATSTAGDLYTLGDLYNPAYADLYDETGAAWSAFQSFSPGSYQTRFLEFAMALATIDPNTIAYDLAFTITITVPARIDHYAATTSASADTTITFRPDGAAVAGAFNGGAGAGNLPVAQWGIVNAQAGDDLIITAISLSQMSFKIMNGGSRVVRDVNLTVEGF